MPATTTFRSERGVIIVPLKKYEPNWTVDIGGIDVSECLIDSSVILPVTNRVRSMSATIANVDGKFTREFTNGDIVKVFADFANADTQIFEGRLETLRYKLALQSGFTIPIFSRGYGADALERKVTLQYDSPDTIKNIFISLRDTYLPNHSSNNTYIEDVTTTYTPSWSGRPLWNCFEDLALEAGNHDFYCDINKIWHFFTKGSLLCTSEAITYGDNVIEMEIVEDMLGLGTRTIVYGRELEGIPQVYVDKDITVESAYGNIIRERQFTFGELVTMAQVRSKASSLLTKLKTIEQTGSTTTIGLPKLNTGENIMVINPYCNVMGYRRVVGLIHTIDTGGFTSRPEFAEEEKGLSTMMGDRVKTEREITTIRNRYSMEDSHIIVFDDEDESEIDSKSKLIVWDDNLILEAGETSGWATTQTYEAPKNISQLVPIISGQNITGSEGQTWTTLKISVNNGGTWEDVNRDELHICATVGRLLKIRITMKSLTTRIKAMGVLMKYAT